jgi:hypothetical protein
VRQSAAYKRSVEAGLTRDELHKYLFRNSTRLPKRRFRVEGTTLGESPLLSIQGAKIVQARHQGIIVDLACVGDCPTCKAEAWSPCVVRQGKRKGAVLPIPHPTRLACSKS